MLTGSYHKYTNALAQWRGRSGTADSQGWSDHCIWALVCATNTLQWACRGAVQSSGCIGTYASTLATVSSRVLFSHHRGRLERHETMVESLAERYRNSMQCHPFGYALYEPAPLSRLSPGTLGFLDEYQKWHPILDLTDAAAVSAAGYTPLGYLQPAPADLRRFGPLTSSNVAKDDVALEAGVDAASLGLPVDVGGVVRCSTSGGFGAVLMCGGDVTSEGFDFREPFLVWLKQNAKVLFSRYPDTKKNGLCVATWTYSADDIAISAWDGGANEVALGFKVGAAGIGHVGPEKNWFRSHASSMWSAWTDQQRVVFFTGVKIKTGILGTREQPEKRWRGEETFMVEGDGEGEEDYRVEAVLFGDDWHTIQDD